MRQYSPEVTDEAIAMQRYRMPTTDVSRNASARCTGKCRGGGTNALPPGPWPDPAKAWVDYPHQPVGGARVLFSIHRTSIHPVSTQGGYQTCSSRDMLFTAHPAGLI